MAYTLAPEFHETMVGWATAPLPGMAHFGGQMESQYAPEIGRAILGRIWLGETVAQIGADPVMPCPATIYQWRRLHAGFRAEWDEMRALKAELRRGARAAARAAAASRPGRRRVRPGARSSYTPEMAQTICDLIEDGAAISEIVRMPGLPSAKAVYGWLHARPDFQRAYAAACVARAERLKAEAQDIALESHPLTLARDRARVARIEGRIGRLTPRTYRPAVLDPRG